MFPKTFNFLHLYFLNTGDEEDDLFGTLPTTNVTHGHGPNEPNNYSGQYFKKFQNSETNIFHKNSESVTFLPPFLPTKET